MAVDSALYRCWQTVNRLTTERFVLQESPCTVNVFILQYAMRYESDESVYIRR